MQITEHFSRQEFDSRDGHQYPAEWIKSRLKPLCEALERVRAQTGPIVITSGYRTPERNKQIGGAKNSQHIHGRAADIKSHGLSGAELADIVLGLIRIGDIPAGGVGIYSNRVHYDTRGTLLIWRGK